VASHPPVKKNGAFVAEEVYFSNKLKFDMVCGEGWRLFVRDIRRIHYVR